MARSLVFQPFTLRRLKASTRSRCMALSRRTIRVCIGTIVYNLQLNRWHSALWRTVLLVYWQATHCHHKHVPYLILKQGFVQAIFTLFLQYLGAIFSLCSCNCNLDCTQDICVLLNSDYCLLSLLGDGSTICNCWKYLLFGLKKSSNLTTSIKQKASCYFQEQHVIQLLFIETKIVIQLLLFLKASCYVVAAIFSCHLIFKSHIVDPKVTRGVTNSLLWYM